MLYDKYVRRFFLFSILFFLFFFTLKKDAFAASCSIKNPVIVENKLIKNLTIQTENLTDGKYWLQFNGDVIRHDDNITWFSGLPDFYNKNDSTMAKGEISVGDLGTVLNDSPQYRFLPSRWVGVAVSKQHSDLLNFANGEFSIKVQLTNGQALCEARFRIEQSASGGECKIQFLNENLKQSDKGFSITTPIKIKVNGLPSENPDAYKHKIILRRNGQDAPKNWAEDCYSRTQLSSEVDLNTQNEGNYYLEIRNACNPGGIGESMACYASFVVPGGVYKAGDRRNIGDNPIPCDVWTNRNNKVSTQKEKCILLKTAIGPVSTDLDDFIKSLFRAILGISGGIAVLLIMIAGYRIMVSQGNPEKVKEAKESLTSAIIGLLFIIFSLLILQVIGVDVLRIPGLTR